MASGAAICALVVTGVGTGSSGAAVNKASTSSAIPPVTMFGEMPATVVNLNTNTFTKFAEKLTGLTFVFDTTPASDLADLQSKQGLVLASGDYPDVIWNGSITNAEALRYGTEDIYPSPARHDPEVRTQPLAQHPDHTGVQGCYHDEKWQYLCAPDRKHLPPL